MLMSALEHVGSEGRSEEALINPSNCHPWSAPHTSSAFLCYPAFNLSSLGAAHVRPLNNSYPGEAH